MKKIWQVNIKTNEIVVTKQKYGQIKKKEHFFKNIKIMWVKHFFLKKSINVVYEFISPKFDAKQIS